MLITIKTSLIKGTKNKSTCKMKQRTEEETIVTSMTVRA